MATPGNQGNLNATDTIGGVNIELLLKDDQFVRALDAAVQRSRTGGRQIDAAFTQAAGETGQGGVKGFSKSLRTAQELTIGLVGRIMSLGGSATVFYRLGASIRENVINAFRSGEEAAKAFSESLDLRDKAGSMRKLRSDIEDLEGRIAESTANPIQNIVNRFARGSIEKMQQELAAKRAQERMISESARAEDRVKAERAISDEIKKEIDSRTLAALDGEAKIAEQKRQDLAKLDELARKASPQDAGNIEELRLLIESDAWSKRMEQMSKTFKEGQQFALELRRASQEWRQAQVGAFGANDIVVEIRQVRELLTRIALQSRGTGSF